MNDVLRELSLYGLVPVIKIEDPAQALPLAKALIAGGLPIAEITFRSARAGEALRRLHDECPDLIAGAGTVINVALAREAIEAGARFIVSPGFNPAVIDFCKERAVPIVPGIDSPSLIEAGLEKGLSVFKLFPAENVGGTAMLDALKGPFPQASFIPTGGIGPKNLGDYAKRSNVLAIGGSWMVKPSLIEAENWSAITGLCAEAVLDLHSFSFAHLDILIKNKKETKQSSEPLALRCNNIGRALAWLERQGWQVDPEGIQQKDGNIIFAYLKNEIAGFAVQLLPTVL